MTHCHLTLIKKVRNLLGYTLFQYVKKLLTIKKMKKTLDFYFGMCYIVV